jgi:hypothetical protein
MRPTSTAELEVLARRAAREPIGCDVSGCGDEWVAGFLAGQLNALQALHRRLLCDCTTGCTACCS